MSDPRYAEGLRAKIEAASFHDDMYSGTGDSRAVLLEDLWPLLDGGIDDVIAALSEDEIAHGEAWDDVRKVGLGSCAYCDDEWPCRTQRGIDALLARLSTPRTETSEP